MIAVIKMDGYGHGAVPVAKKIDNQVDAYAVATIDEGINLRINGIENDFLILSSQFWIINNVHENGSVFFSCLAGVNQFLWFPWHTWEKAAKL